MNGWGRIIGAVSYKDYMSISLKKYQDIDTEKKNYQNIKLV